MNSLSGNIKHCYSLHSDDVSTWDPQNSHVSCPNHQFGCPGEANDDQSMADHLRTCPFQPIAEITHRTILERDAYRHLAEVLISALHSDCPWAVLREERSRFCWPQETSEELSWMAESRRDTQRLVRVTLGRALKKTAGSQIQELRVFEMKEIEEMTCNFSHVIGEGGFGVVYLGTLPDGTQVAVKKEKDPDARLSPWESLVLHKCRHPNIVSVLGVAPDDNCLVMERLVGGSLATSSSLTWRHRIQVILQLASALWHVHSMGLVHGDVKPDNILLDDFGNAKLIDFGFAKRMGDGAGAGGRDQPLGQGTIGYVCPNFLTTMELNPTLDVYAFGLTILQMLTGLPKVGDLHTTIDKCRRRISGRVHNVDALTEEFLGMLDPSAGEWDLDVGREVVRLAVSCVRRQPLDRPSMEEIVPGLERVAAAAAAIESISGVSSEWASMAAIGSVKSSESGSSPMLRMSMGDSSDSQSESSKLAPKGTAVRKWRLSRVRRRLEKMWANSKVPPGREQVAKEGSGKGSLKLKFVRSESILNRGYISRGGSLYTSQELKEDEDDDEKLVEVAKSTMLGSTDSLEISKALSYLNSAMWHGNANAEFLLGLCYFGGVGVDKIDQVKAAELYAKSASSGHPTASIALGLCYFDGTGVEKDTAKGAELATNGLPRLSSCPIDIFFEGVCKYKGLGDLVNEKVAVECLRKSSEGGFWEAQYWLGRCYHWGIRYSEDDKLAMKWYRRAAEHGHAEAQYAVGWRYEVGKGVRMDRMEAAEWYSKAATKGHQKAVEKMDRPIELWPRFVEM